MSSALQNLIIISVSILQSIFMSYFVYSVLGDKKNKAFYSSGGVLCTVALTVVLLLINYINHNQYFYFYPVIYSMLLFTYSFVCLDGCIFAKIGCSVLSAGIITGTDILMNSAFFALFNNNVYSPFSANELTEVLSVLINQLVLLYFYYGMEKLLTKNKNNILKINEWFLIVAILAMSIMIVILLNVIGMNSYSNTIRLYLIIAFMGIVIINIVTIYLVSSLSKRNRTARENELLKWQQRYQSQYVENAGAQYDTIRKMRHDFKNNYVVLETLIKEGRVDKALEYIEKNLNSVSGIISLVKTNNDVVNAIINSKAAFAKSEGIDITCMTVSDFNGLDDLDLSNLLGNMFDNAIRACEEYSGKGLINLSITGNLGIYNINMKNTVEKSVLEQNPNLNTTKKDKNSHGLGTSIIKDIAAKYKGRYDFYEEDKYFCCNVLLRSMEE